MAITKQNTYEIGVNNDISNLSVNVDRNRLGEDKVIIENNGANLDIKVGSLIEANGSLWAVDTSDISIVRTDGYLVFDDSVPEFKIINSETAELDPTRGGFYRPAPNDTEKVTRWDISGTDLILNTERVLYAENATKLSRLDVEGAAEIGGQLTINQMPTHKNIQGGRVGSGSTVVPSIVIPAGLYFIRVYPALTGTSVLLEARDNGGVWRAIGQASANVGTGSIEINGMYFSDGTNLRITLVSGTYGYEYIRVGF